MYSENISAQIFIDNRKRFVAQMEKNSIAIFNSNDEIPTNGDALYPFKQNSDLYWLTGIRQEDTMLILFPDNNEGGGGIGSSTLSEIGDSARQGRVTREIELITRMGDLRGADWGGRVRPAMRLAALYRERNQLEGQLKRFLNLPPVLLKKGSN